MKNAKREIIGLALLLEDISECIVFVNYSGHVKKVSVNVAEGNYENKIFQGSFYVDFRYEEDKKKYEKIKTFLQTEIDKCTAV